MTPQFSQAMDRDQDVYASPARYLELICHLCCYSPLMVLIRHQSEVEAGALATAVAESYAESGPVLKLTAAELDHPRHLIARLALVFGVTSLPADEVAAREAILEKARFRADSSDPLLVLVDQAENLPLEMLQALAQFALMSSHAISFCLFGREGFDQGLKEGPAVAPVYRISLPEPSRSGDFPDLLLDEVSHDVLPPDNQQQAVIDQSATPRQSGIGHALGVVNMTALSLKLRSPLVIILVSAVLLTLMVLWLLYDDGVDDVSSTVLQVPLPPVFVQSDRSLAAMPEEDLSVPSQVVRNPTHSGDQGMALDRGAGVAQTDARPSAATQAAPKQGDLIVPGSLPSRLSGYPIWLKSGEGWGIQLLGTSEPQGARDFVAKWQSEADGKLVWYRSQRNGQPWYVVLAGVFSSREDATVWLVSRPGGFKKGSPWVRKMSQIAPQVEPL